MGPFDSLLAFLVENTGVILLVLGLASIVSLVLISVMLVRMQKYTKPLDKLKKGESGGAEHIPAIMKAVTG